MLSDQTVQTLITSIAGIGIAFFGYLGGRAVIRRNRRNGENGEPEEEREAVQRYSDNPSQFIKDVLRSNEQLTNRVDAAEKKADRIERAFETFKREDRKFRTALARWVGRLMSAWGTEDDMPYPEGEDALTLADVIPSALEATQPRIPRINKPPFAP